MKCSIHWNIAKYVYKVGDKICSHFPLFRFNSCVLKLYMFGNLPIHLCFLVLPKYHSTIYVLFTQMNWLRCILLQSLIFAQKTFNIQGINKILLLNYLTMGLVVCVSSTAANNFDNSFAAWLLAGKGWNV